MNNLIISLIVIPLMGAAVCSVGKILSNVTICKVTTILSLAASFVFLLIILPELRWADEFVFIAGGWSELSGIALGIDMLSWIISALILLICFCSILFAFAEDSYSPLFYFTFLMMIAAMQGVLMTRDLFNLFVFFEILAIASYILIAYFQKSHSVFAAFKYLIIGSAAMMFYLIGVFIIYQATGSLSFDAISQMSAEHGLSPALLTALGAIITGIGVRTAFVPFHTWLPDAHAHAPHPVSAVLSGVMIKVAFVSLWRILDLVNSPDLLSLLLWLGVISAFLAALRAFFETDIKKILAFSSVSQIGYIVAAFGTGTILSRTASLYHIVNHAIFKCLLFLLIGAVIRHTGERDIGKIRGLAPNVPLLALLFIVGAMAIAGLPPFNGYISKKLITDAASANPLPYALLWSTGIVTLAAYIRLSVIFRGKKTSSQIRATEPVPKLTYVPIILLGIASLITGLIPSFWIGVFSVPARAFSIELVIPGFYSAGALFEVLLIVSTALLLYRFSYTSAGYSTARFLSIVKPGLNGALFLLTAGFAALTLFILNIGSAG